MTHLGMPAIVIVGLLAACGGAQPPAAMVGTLSPDAAVTAVVVTTSDAAPADAPPPVIDAAPPAIDATPVAIPTTRPALKGKPVTVTLNDEKLVGGVKVRFAANNHKHRVGGGAMGMFTFELRRGGKTLELELRSELEGFEAEIDAHGVLLVFEHVGYGEFRVTPGARRTPPPLDDDACVAAIEQAAATAGLPASSSRSYGESDGILYFRTEGWTAACGRYTRRIWFMPANRDD